MHIEQIDHRTDDAALRTCHELVISGQSEDDPNVPALSFGMFRGYWSHGFAGEPRQVWLARTDGGTPIGCYLLEVPDRENQSNAFPFVAVGLTARRRGAGTILLAHAADQAALAGRSLLMSSARLGSPAAAFCRDVGARPDLQDGRRILDVGPQLPQLLAELRAEAEKRAADYTLRSWSGPTPADLIDGVCALNTAMEDAPHEEAFEPTQWDADRVHLADAGFAQQGLRWYSVAAIRTATGEMAALTQLGIDPDVEGWGFQEITAVTRPHRGHRLGLLVKVAMLDWLATAEPQVRHIVTYNSTQNAHMIEVNDRLGSRVSDTFESYEMDVESARKLASDG